MADPMVGRVIADRFTVLSRLGEGAMGTVYRAKQSPIGREVAIKILRSERALDEASRARFLREARANSLLTSPHTVTVFDFGADAGGEFYLAMELLEGESLGQRLKRTGRLSPPAALHMAKQALRSLSEAHAKGIIHRDLKPDNLFFARRRTNAGYDELVKVLDFGIAKMLRADDELAMNAIETQAGTVFGTPRYMSPEQAQGKVLDARSDLYSLGVILYQVLTGRAPFTDDDAIVVMARHIKTMPRPIHEVAPDAQVPPAIESAVMRVLSKDPANRPQTAEAMSAELARALETALSATSGVRASVSSTTIEARRHIGADAVLESGANPVAAPPLAPRVPSAPFAPPRAAFRGWSVAAGLAAVTVVAMVLVAVDGDRSRDPRADERSSPALAPSVPTLPIALDPEVPGLTTRSDPAAPSPAASASDARSPVASGSRVQPAQPDSHAGPLPSSLRRHTGPGARPAGATSSSPASPAGSVGYGYLE